MEEKKLIVIMKRDKLWLEKRSFINCKFQYKDIEFILDVKAMKTPLKNTHINKKPIFNIIEKHSRKTESPSSYIPVVDINFIVAEKLLVFHKKFITKVNVINDESQIIENYDINRLFRHVYDVFMIFDKELICQDNDSLLIINKHFKTISRYEENNFNTPLNKINVFQTDFFNNNTEILALILKKECYEKIDIKKLILFYKTLGEKMNILLNNF